jgi:hypothetical protein
MNFIFELRVCLWILLQSLSYFLEAEWLPKQLLFVHIGVGVNLLVGIEWRLA